MSDLVHHETMARLLIATDEITGTTVLDSSSQAHH